MKENKFLNSNKGIKAVILIMIALVLIGVSIAYVHYGDINKSEDPRVLKAKYQYKAYNIFVKNNDIESVFATLDTISDIYSQFSDYRNSYEVGVVNNNVAAVWLSMGLKKIHEKQDGKNELDSAEKYCLIGVPIYEEWLNEFGKLSEKEIAEKVTNYYDATQPYYVDNDITKIINKRIKDIQVAQIETPKRLSVALTNLGIVQRHKLEYDKAMENYKKALTLWEGNRSAKNNINILLGRPVEEMTTIEKLFPDEKED